MAMKSEWKITSNFIGDQKMFRVYRLLDQNEPDHSGNREYEGDYVSGRDLANDIARNANEQEVNNAEV